MSRVTGTGTSPPGTHVILFGDAGLSISARRAGWEVRDCILVPGLGTAWLLRVPIAEDTVAKQVLKTGTGALWIDGCRIGNSGGMTKHTTWAGSDAWEGNRTTGVWVDHGGRWPTNLVLMHEPGCVCNGTKQARTSSNSHGAQAGITLDRRTQATVYGDYGRMSGVSHVGENGKETIPAWACVPGCLVTVLDGQSGMLTTNPGTITKDMAPMGFHGGSGSARTVKADTGGASRFYPQLLDRHDVEAWFQRLTMGAK